MSAGWIIIGLAWLIALIVLGIALVVSRVRSRRRIEELQRYFENRPKSEGVSAVATSEDKWFGNLAVRDFTSLMILDLELEWSHQRGELDKDRYLQLRAGWETMWSEQLRIGGLEPDGDEWQQRRDEAWQLFVERQHQPPGLPPWRRDLPQPEKLQPSPEVVASCR